MPLSPRPTSCLTLLWGRAHFLSHWVSLPVAATMCGQALKGREPGRLGPFQLLDAWFFVPLS